MLIKRVKIENYRSIKSLTFHPSRVCALVGENGAGKTNILAALEFLLGDKWPMSNRLEVSDYYNHDESREIFIGVEFEPNEHDIGYICFKQGFEKGQCRWGKSGVKGQTLGSSPFLTSDIRQKCALVYLEATRDLDNHLRASPWTLFGRITSEFDAQFPTESRTALEEHFGKALALLRTKRFAEFEKELERGFRDQLKHTTHDLNIEFKAFDPRSYYRSLNLVLRRDDDERLRLPEAGQGIRNLALLALFRAYASVLKGDAIIAVEEPEIYLHPHAQRSLASLFNSLAEQGNQVFFSTHASNFVNLESFEQVCLVERCLDSDGERSTTVCQVTVDELLKRRQALYPSVPMTGESVKKRLHNISRLEHSEAFFAKKIVLVEGETEQYSIPIYAAYLGCDLDSLGVSIVSAEGKTNLDTFFQLYDAFQIPVYLIFDNDAGKQSKDREHNKVLTRLLAQEETLDPRAEVAASYAILGGDFESEMKQSLGSSNYESLQQEASQHLGANAGKGLKARFMAQRLVEAGNVPEFMKRIVEAIQVFEAPPRSLPTDGVSSEAAT